MIGFNLGGPEGIIILVLVLVMFGGSQIPKLARNLGRAQREFQDGIEAGQRSASSLTNATSTPESSDVGDSDGVNRSA